MNKAPAFQFYPADWLDFRVQRMSYDAQGVYMKMLCFMWKDSDNQYSIPSDHKTLAKALGIPLQKFRKIFAEIQHKDDPIFVEKDGLLISERLKEEKKKQDKYRREQAKKGKKSAELRKLRSANRSSAVVEPQNQPNFNRGSALQSSTSSSTDDLNNELEADYRKVTAWFERSLGHVSYYPPSSAQASREHVYFLVKKVGPDLLIDRAQQTLDRVLGSTETPDIPRYINWFFREWDKLAAVKSRSVKGVRNEPRHDIGAKYENCYA